MKVYGLTLNLKDDPEIIARYKHHHRHPWPETISGLVEVGIVDMKIFLLGRRMFMFLTGTDDFDPAVDFPRYIAANPRAGEWDVLMRTFQEKVPEAGPDEWWAAMEQVFDMQEHLPGKGGQR